MRSLLMHLLCVTCLCLMFTPNIYSAEKKEEKKEPDLHELMEAVGKDYKAVYKAVKSKSDDSKAEAIKTLDRLRANCVKAKAFVPHKAEKIKDAEAKKKMIDGYKKEMDVLIANVDKLKKSVNAGEWDAAMKTIKAMKTHKGESHDKYQEEEHDHEH